MHLRKLLELFCLEAPLFGRTGLSSEHEMYWDEFEHKYPEAAKTFPGGYYTGSTTFSDEGGKIVSKGGFPAEYDQATKKWNQAQEPEEWDTL